MSTENPAAPIVAQEETVNQVEVNVPFTDNFVYSNITALSTSFMDVRISFGEMLPDGKAQARIGVVLPPEHAAQLVLNLMVQLNFFESNFGKIRHPQWRAFRDKAMAEIQELRDVAKKAKDAIESTKSRQGQAVNVEPNP